MNEIDTGSHTYGDPGYPKLPGAFRIVEGPDPALLAVLERIAVALEKIAENTEPSEADAMANLEASASAWGSD